MHAHQADAGRHSIVCTSKGRLESANRTAVTPLLTPHAWPERTLRPSASTLPGRPERNGNNETFWITKNPPATIGRLRANLAIH